MGSHRKKKLGSGKLATEEAAVSSTSSSSTTAAAGYMQDWRGSKSNILPALSKSVDSGCSTLDPKRLNTPTWPTNFPESSCTDQVEGSKRAMRLSCEEMLLLALILVAFVGISMFVGVAAGISISIHHYEAQENYEVRSLTQPLMLSSLQRVTTLDPTIANAESFYTKSQKSIIRRVVHTSPSGKKSILPVVEESSMHGQGGARFSEEWTEPMTTTSEKAGLSLPLRPRLPHTVVDDWLQHQPKLCSDHKTVGYDSWFPLLYALRDVNRYSADRYNQWQDYFVAVSKLQESLKFRTIELSPSTFDDDSAYYDEEIVFTICPGATLRPEYGGSPLYINTESVRIECDGCTITAGTSHMSFGPDARNVVVRGVTFIHAASSSLVFHHDGAEATFQDCTWVVRKGMFSSLGAVTEINSTSTIDFYRCSVDKPSGSITIDNV